MLRYFIPLTILAALAMSITGCCKSHHANHAPQTPAVQEMPPVPADSQPATDEIPATVPATQPVAATLPAANAVIGRIALVSDTHIALGDNYQPYIDHFQTVIQQVNASDAEIVLLSGDLAQDPVAAWQVKFHEMVGTIEKPTLFVAGNHDIGNKPIGGAASKVTAELLTQYKTNIGELWFSKQINPQVRVIGFASTLVSSGLPEEKQQWDFLQAELAKTTPGYTLILTHIPIFMNNIDEVDSYNNLNRTDRQRYWDLIKSGHVQGILSGHLHFPMEQKYEGIAFIGAPAVSFGQDVNGKKVGWKSIELHADGTFTSELHYLPEPGQMAPAQPAPNK